MDLVATVTENQSVDVWRFNGQRVFGVAAEDEGDGHVEALAWRSDGQVLAVCHSNGVLQLIDSFSGKVAHRLQTARPTSVSSSFTTSQQSAASSTPSLPYTVSSLSWMTHFANSRYTRQQLETVSSNVLLDDLLGLNPDFSKILKLKADLPGELASIDIEASLPKLSSLPVTAADDDVFSSRSSIDSIFHSQNAAGATGKGKVDAVHTLVVGSVNSLLHIQIFDSFEIGTINLSHALLKGLIGNQIVKQVSHPFLSTHFVLLGAENDIGKARPDPRLSGTDPSFHLLTVDLRFIPQTGHNLPLLATKATQLQNLLRYLSQIQTQLTHEVKAAFDLPARFLRNVNESLAEHDERATFVTAAYHLAVTGECDPRLKEWLVDEVGERGLKRWDKAVGDCLDMVRRMTSECLLPALERCQVVLSRLDGLSRFSGTSARLGLDEKSIRAIRDSVDVLVIVSEDLLKDVCVELREFGAFMRWLKWESEVESLEEGSERAEELRETYSGEGELGMVLDYINGGLGQTRVLRYVDAVSTGTSPPEGDADAEFHANFKGLRSSVSKDKRLPKMGDLLFRIKDRSGKVFSRIAETLRKSILTSYIVELPSGMDVNKVEMRVTSSKEHQEIYKLHLLASVKEDSGKLAYMVLHMLDESGKGLRRTSHVLHQLQMPSEAKILDFKFVDDGGLIVLATALNDKQILWHATDDDDNFREGDWETRHVFDEGQMGSGMRPATLQVNGRKGRRAIAVFDEAGLGYVVFDLDSEGPPDTGEGDQAMTGC